MIINNENYRENHYEQLNHNLENSDCLYIISPFIGKNIDDLIDLSMINNLKRIVLVTTFKKNNVDQIKKIKSLYSFIETLNKYGIDLNVQINNRLHAKIYLFEKDMHIIKGIITSANFTTNGLYRNCEWGVEIDDIYQLSKIKIEMIDLATYQTFGEDMIIKMYNKLQQLNIENSERSEDINLNLLDEVDFNFDNLLQDYTNIWLKPVGVSDYPIKIGESFGYDLQRLEFSKQKPNGICLNDIIIAYGVGPTNVLSIYKNTSEEPIMASELELLSEPWRERWPWSITGYNITPYYGDSWWNYTNTLNSLQNEYLKKYPKRNLTTNSQSLGGLNFGKDKLRLNKNFGLYIINKIMSENNKISV